MDALISSLCQPHDGGPGLLLEVERAAGMQKQLFWPGSCCPRACPAHADHHRTWAGCSGLTQHPVPPAEPSGGWSTQGCWLVSTGPFPSLNRHLCWASSLSLRFPCAFPGSGSCCSFCLASLCSLFCLVKSLFSRLAL